MILVILLGMFIGLSAIGVPIAIALGITSSFVLLVLQDVPIAVIVQRIFSGMDSFPLMAIPLFVLAGNAMNVGGTTSRIVRFSNAIIGHKHGGLAQINVLASMFFGGISGSAVADTSSIGGILIPSMIQEKYNRGFSASITAFSSALGPIIPPSITMVVYGITTGNSIRRLFISGAVPGILYGLGLMIAVAHIARKNEYPKSAQMTLREKLRSFRDVIWALLMPIVVIGGILTGVFTVTESAAIAAIYAILAGVFVYRGIDSLRKVYEILRDSVVLIVSIMILIGSAKLYSWLLVTNRVPNMISDLIFSITQNPMGVLLLVNVFMIIVGMFVEANAAIVIFVPIFYPVIIGMGIDPIHFGVVVVFNLCLGLVTPPVGLCLNLASKIARCSLLDAIRSSGWFFVVGVFVLLLITYWPGMVLFLPRLLGL